MSNEMFTRDENYVKPWVFVCIVIGLSLIAYFMIASTALTVESDTYFIIGVYSHLQDSGVSITAGTTNGLTHKSFNTSYPFKLGHAYFITSEGDNLISVVEVKLD